MYSPDPLSLCHLLHHWKGTVVMINRTAFPEKLIMRISTALESKQMRVFDCTP